MDGIMMTFIRWQERTMIHTDCFRDLDLTLVKEAKLRDEYCDSLLTTFEVSRVLGQYQKQALA